MRPLVVAMLLLGLPLAGCVGPPAQPPPGQAPDEAGSGPAWSFVDTDGETHTRDAPPRDASVLFFMATWCGTCQSKTGALAAVHADYAERGVRFYSLDFDPSETEEQLEAWKTRYDQPWPHGIDPGLATQRTFDVRTTSEVVVLDATGHVVVKFPYGRVTEATLRDALDEALSA